VEPPAVGDFIGVQWDGNFITSSTCRGKERKVPQKNKIRYLYTMAEKSKGTTEESRKKKTHVSRNLQINPHPHCWALAHIPVHTKNAVK
jgi:hypothetical protein